MLSFVEPTPTTFQHMWGLFSQFYCSEKWGFLIISLLLCHTVLCNCGSSKRKKREKSQIVFTLFLHRSHFLSFCGHFLFYFGILDGSIDAAAAKRGDRATHGQGMERKQKKGKKMWLFSSQGIGPFWSSGQKVGVLILCSV